MDVKFVGQGFEVDWADSDGWFGEITFYKDKDGNMKVISETMGKEFVKKILCQLVDIADLID